MPHSTLDERLDIPELRIRIVTSPYNGSKVNITCPVTDDAPLLVKRHANDAGCDSMVIFTLESDLDEDRFKAVRAELIDSFNATEEQFDKGNDGGASSPTALDDAAPYSVERLCTLHNAIRIRGYEVFRELFVISKPLRTSILAANADLEYALRQYLLDLLRSDVGCRIGVHCLFADADRYFLFPWNLVFSTNEEATGEEECFKSCWGFRHAIVEDIPRLGHPNTTVEVPPRVLTIINDTLDVGFDGDLSVHDGKHHPFLAASLGGSSITSLSEFTSTFSELKDNIVYFFGHSHDADGEEPWIELPSSERYTPDNYEALPRPVGSSYDPHLIMINGCNSAAVFTFRPSTLVGSMSIREEYQHYRVHCVTTANKIHRSYAAHFGLAFAHHLLTKSMPVEDALLLSRKLLFGSPKHRWPHGLFYNALSGGGLRFAATTGDNGEVFSGGTI